MRSLLLLALLGCCSTLAFAQDPADAGQESDGTLDRWWLTPPGGLRSYAYLPGLVDPTDAEIEAIERIRVLDRGLSRIFWLVALVGIAGGIVGLALLNAIGALLGWLGLGSLHQPFDMISMLGFLILMGTVVNNPILIVDRAIQRLQETQCSPIEAVRDAVASRLRPIAMSTLTTICGLSPLVFIPGAGTELYRGVGGDRAPVRRACLEAQVVVHARRLGGRGSGLVTRRVAVGGDRTAGPHGLGQDHPRAIGVPDVGEQHEAADVGNRLREDRLGHRAAMGDTRFEVEGRQATGVGGVDLLSGGRDPGGRGGAPVRGLERELDGEGEEELIAVLRRDGDASVRAAAAEQLTLERSKQVTVKGWKKPTKKV